MLITLLGLGKVSSLLLIEGEYYSDNCNGAPDNIYVFETQYAFTFMPWLPFLNETWPPYYQFHSTEATVGTPGAEFVPLPGQVCIDSLSYTQSKPYYSGYTLFYTGGYSLDSIPTAANGLQYCYLVSNDFSNPSNLNGYKAAYFLPNDNTCYDNHYKCSKDGVFTYFVGETCSGATETLSLNSTLSTTISPNLGNISFQFYTIQGATMFFSWITKVPHNSNVPNFTTAGDWFALLFAVLSLIIGLYMLIRTLHVLRAAEKKQLAKIINFSAQIFYFAYYISSTCYWSMILTRTQKAAVSTGCFVFLGIGTLLDCILTSYLVANVLFLKKKVLVQWVNIVTIVLLHFATFGSSYGGMYILNIGPPTFAIPLLISMGEWQKLSVLWILFTFIYNTTVPILVALKLLKLKGEDRDTKKEMNKVDPNLKYYIVAQFGAFAMYAIPFILQNYTYALGNDSGYQNAIPYIYFAMACHTFLTSKIFGIISASSHYKSNSGSVPYSTLSRAVKR